MAKGPNIVMYFGDDEQLKIFLQVINEFSTLQIDDEHLNGQKLDYEKGISSLNLKIVGHNVIQLSNNLIPKCLVL